VEVRGLDTTAGEAARGDTFARRSVCIVGNGGDDGSISPADIDGHDVVVRFNDATLDGSLGRRIDVYATTFRKEVRSPPSLFRDRGARLATLSRAAPPADLGARVEVWEASARALEGVLGCWPSSGLVAMFEAVGRGARCITLAGMDLAPSLARDPKWPEGYAPPSLYHNFIGEQRVFRDLVRSARESGTTFRPCRSLARLLPKAARPRVRVDAHALVTLDLPGAHESLAATDRERGRDDYRRLVQRLRAVVARGASRGPDPVTLTLAIDAVSATERYYFLSQVAARRRFFWWLFDSSLSPSVEAMVRFLRTVARDLSVRGA